MPNLTLSDGELLKKTLRTTLVMVGSTALWLGMLSGVVLISTGSSASGAAESKGEKAEKGAGAVHGPGPVGPLPRNAPPRPGMRGPSDPPKSSGDPI